MTSLIYDTGTVAVTNGNATVTGNLTGWAVALVTGGVFSSAGMSIPIASVESDTSLTLAYPWPGTTGSGKVYAIAREYSEVVRAAWTNDRLATIIQRLSLMGVHPDGSGTIAERDALSPVPSTGYIWLYAEAGNDLEFYRKSASGWDGPFQVVGDTGAQGPVGHALVPAGEWASGTTYDAGDYVSFGDRTFASLDDSNVDNEPPSSDVDDTHWMFLPSIVGPKGDTGDTGATGATGATGPKGDTGDVSLNGVQTLTNKTLTAPVINNGSHKVGSTQTTAPFGNRVQGNQYEFGHANPAGYGCSIGAGYSSGHPFIVFFGEAGTNDNTFRTRGYAAIGLQGNNSASTLEIFKAPTASADNQTAEAIGAFTQSGFLDMKGGFKVNGTALATVATSGDYDDLTNAPSRYVGFYNGQGPNTSPANVYNFGLALGSSPLAMGRAGILAPTFDHATTYKDTSGRQCPCPVLVGDRIFVFYEGYDGTRKSIFLEIYSKEGRLMEKPIEPVILYSDVSGATSVQRPAVLYEPTDTGAPFKMLFTRATSGVNATTIYAATSLDGVNWTVLGLVLSNSTGWESTYLETTGRFLKDGSTYRLFYSGYNGTYWQSGELYNSGTFGTSGWSKNSNNPLLAPRGGYLQALTANATQGTKTVKVADSSVFDVGAVVALCENGAGSSYQMNRIAAIPDSTTVTLLYAVQGNYTTAITSCLSQLTSRSVEISDVWYEDGKWKSIITGFQFVKSGVLVETTGYAETADLSTPFTIHPSEWPLPLNTKLNVWDQISSENFKFVKIQ